MAEHDFTQRRACRLIGISRSSLAYQARPDRHARLRERLITLFGKHRKYGYRMLHAKLARENFKVNVKVVERIYREERLWLRRTKRKKIPREGREGGWCRLPPTRGGHSISPATPWQTVANSGLPISRTIAPASVRPLRWISLCLASGWWRC